MNEEQSAAKNKSLTGIWINRIEDALKREKDFRLAGRECVSIYEGEKVDETPFAILYSNTETLIPAVYSQPPVPIVDRRFKDPDPLGKLAAEAGTRTLKFLLDASSEDEDSFDESVQADVLGALVTNRGLSRCKYDAHIYNGEVSGECVYFESVRWDKFLHGYARTWKKVPWIGFEWDMDRREVIANFGEDIANKIDFNALPEGWGEQSDDRNKSTDRLAGVKLVKVYEIWDKDSKKVMFFSPAYKDAPMKVLDDPLKLSGFFPVPKPLNFMRKVTTLTPTPLYIQYRQQARELNELTRRLTHVIKALKIRGFYNNTIQGIEKVLDAEDNTLIPAENMQALPDSQQNGDKIVWLMPIAELSTVAQNLFQEREQVKQTIYEITGISDILRGASVASETATAQNIKNQWGTLRLKKMQREVQRYCRDLMAIALEIAVERFSVQTMSQMTGLPYPTQAQKQQQLMQMQGQAQSAMQQAAMSGQQIPPEVQQQFQQQMQELQQQATWEDVLSLLKNDVQRHYRIDIETNSTIDAAASEDKQEISDLLNALSQFMNGIGPLIQEGAMPFDVAKQMLLAICRRYTFGPQLEDALQKMQAPPPKQGDPADQVKLQVEQAKAATAQQQAQADQKKIQMEMEQSQLEAAIKVQELQNQKEMMALEMEMKREEIAAQRAKLALDQASNSMKLEQAGKAHSLKMASMEESHNLQMEQRRQQAAEAKKNVGKKEPA